MYRTEPPRAPSPPDHLDCAGPVRPAVVTASRGRRTGSRVLRALRATPLGPRRLALAAAPGAHAPHQRPPPSRPGGRGAHGYRWVRRTAPVGRHANRTRRPARWDGGSERQGAHPSARTLGRRWWAPKSAPFDGHVGPMAVGVEDRARWPTRLGPRPSAGTRGRRRWAPRSAPDGRHAWAAAVGAHPRTCGRFASVARAAAPLCVQRPLLRA